MNKVMIVGIGRIGSLVACLLAQTSDYHVVAVDQDCSHADAKRLLDKTPHIKQAMLDVKNESALVDFIKKNKIDAVISCLPYHLNPLIAQAAKATNVHYFDLTEDVYVTRLVKSLALNAESAFVPQCGLAPGFTNIATANLINDFDTCLHAKLRVGALPQSTANTLHYSLTWSTDGLINEYGNWCHGIEGAELVNLKPLSDLEPLVIDGCTYEAFNTSGGLGSLAECYLGKVQTLNYKTIRYPGHCEKMRFLLHDLRLNSSRELLKTILEEAIPKTYKDIVVIYLSAEGYKQGHLTEQTYIKKIYPTIIDAIEWTAIQVSTAYGVCAVVDIVLNYPTRLHGFIMQHQFTLGDVLGNRFGKFFAE